MFGSCRSAPAAPATSGSLGFAQACCLGVVSEMKCLKKFCCFPFNNKVVTERSIYASALHHNANSIQGCAHRIQNDMGSQYIGDIPRAMWSSCTLPQCYGFGKPNMSFLVRPISAPSLYSLQSDRRSSSFGLSSPSSSFHRAFGQSIRMEHSLTRSWFVKLWAAEKRKKIQTRKRRPQITKPVQQENTIFETLSSFRLPSFGSVLNRPVVAEQEGRINRTINHPSTRQFDEGFLSSSSEEEVKLAPLLARPNLLITRDIEWANVMFAFEQESRYIVVDPNYPHSPVGHIHEQSNVIYRQLFRRRRPFVASITDAMGDEIFRIRRPFWLINSTIYVEAGEKVVGVVHRRWHLWRRIYDLYLGNKQFAVVENPGFWNWIFTLKDEEENVLAQIDRDWRGLGLEIFTDAGQYVIRFGDHDSSTKFGMTSAIPEVEVTRPLTLTERAVVIALAVSLDTDYFSHVGGWGLPIVIVDE